MKRVGGSSLTQYGLEERLVDGKERSPSVDIGRCQGVRTVQLW